jgi:hypothetical protein
MPEIDNIPKKLHVYRKKDEAGSNGVEGLTAEGMSPESPASGAEGFDVLNGRRKARLSGSKATASCPIMPSGEVPRPSARRAQRRKRGCGIAKTEAFAGKNPPGGEETVTLAQEYIRFHNTERFRKRLGRLSPAEYREKPAA